MTAPGTDASGDDPPAASTRGQFQEAARSVAALPNVSERLLRQHVADAHGDCAGCGTYTSTRWPCALVHIARLAQRINQPSGRSGRAEWGACG
ncbi:MAG: hypothetical protein J2P20_17090 [Pseudonocardia sp.]|nr:hypothetical protein [Pseudonocardia sp.]